jgi:hypothetical protein
MFKVGEKVRHVSTGKYGVVLESFSDGTGPRYLVQHSGYTWSIPSWALRAVGSAGDLNNQPKKSNDFRG